MKNAAARECMRWMLIMLLLAPGTLAEQVIPLTLDVRALSCSARLGLEVSANEISSGTPLVFTHNLTPPGMKATIEYDVLWDDGTVVKQPTTIRDTRPRSITPKTNTTRTLVITSRVLRCDDATPEDTVAVARVLVRAPDATRATEPGTRVRPARLIPMAKTPAPSPKRFAVWLLVGIIGALGAVLVWRR